MTTATEVGRQHWIVYWTMRTTEAAGENPALWWLYGVTVVVYAAMTWGATMNTLILPLLFALLGIVLRGAAFAFRKYAATLGQAF